jgi:hypothetical protein
MYAFHIPAEMTRQMISIAWNLGEVYFTGGALTATESEGIEVNLLLLKHLVGDYGEISSNPIDHQRMVAARSEGRPFQSRFDLEDDCIKIVTHPVRNRTVVCLATED